MLKASMGLYEPLIPLLHSRWPLRFDTRLSRPNTPHSAALFGANMPVRIQRGSSRTNRKTLTERAWFSKNCLSSRLNRAPSCLSTSSSSTSSISFQSTAWCHQGLIDRPVHHTVHWYGEVCSTSTILRPQDEGHFLVNMPGCGLVTHGICTPCYCWCSPCPRPGGWLLATHTPLPLSPCALLEHQLRMVIFRWLFWPTLAQHGTNPSDLASFSITKV